MGIAPAELIGERVKLIPMRESHVAGLFEAGRDPQIWTYMPMQVNTIDDMRRLVSDALSGRAKGSEFPFVIMDQQSDKIVGSTRFLDISISHRHAEIGWTWLAPHVWRTRINTECKYLLLRHGFETLDLIRVQLKTDRRNLTSQQAIERIGGQKEGILRKHRIMPNGYIRDSVYYSILDEEWPLVKTRLQRILNG
ncbi:MAG: GNAT family protein [Thermaerobacter sp.]|nr:GNAT family protein [Thermaerobacter sp.]